MDAFFFLKVRVRHGLKSNSDDSVNENEIYRMIFSSAALFFYDLNVA